MPDIYISKTNTPNQVSNKRKRFGSKTRKKRLGKMGFFSAYAYHPGNVHFENQEKGEHIELFLRQHPITNLPWIFLTTVMLLAPLVLRFFPFLEFLPVRFQVVSILIWYLISVAFALENLLGWVFNVYIITNKRVVDVDFHNLIYKEVSDAELEAIQDVTYRMGGVARTVFNYGDILIQTAGAAPNFEFLAVPNPDRVVRVLQDLREGKHAGI